MADAKQVMELRALTNAGVMDAKSALDEAGGDVQKAADLLRKKGIAKADRKSDRATAEGVIHAYVHANGKVGAMVEVLCETDFVARNEQFQQFVHDLAMHIVASNPLYVRSEDVPAEVLEKEKQVFVEEVAAAGKPPEIVEKIVSGKLEKYLTDVCLMKQPFVKDEDVTIEELTKSVTAKVGENIKVKRFVRMSLEAEQKPQE